MSTLTAPEARTRDADKAPAPSLIAGDQKTGGMPMTTPLPGLWTESPLLNGNYGERR
ncbi:MAG: hypothetical protein R3E83_12860 [Burkholderiaceae bacterium]